MVGSKGNFLLLVLFSVSVLLLSGCRTPALRHDQDCFRQALISMETNQIMDNLILAYRGYPIVHIDYGSISGTVTDTYSGSVNGSYTDVVGGAITRVASVLIGASEQRQLGVTGEPIRDDPGIYTAYLQFLGIDGSIVETLEPPPSGAAHICRCYEGLYYWVPIEHRGDFFKLAMRITGIRTQPLVASPFFELTITSARAVHPKNKDQLAPGRPCKVNITFKETVKGDDGAIEIDFGGKRQMLSVIPNKNPIGVKTNQLTIVYAYGKDEEEGEFDINPFDLAEGLAGNTVNFYPTRYRPQAPKADKLLNKIEKQLNGIRTNQLRISP